MSEVSYRPLIEDMVWSYSRIKCFDDCRYCWFLKYIKHCKETPQFFSSYGSFMHRLIEQYYKGEISQEEMYTKFLFDFTTEVQGVRPQGNTVKKYIQAGLNYLKTFKPFPYNMVAVEKKIDFEIDGIPFVGVIDYLGERDGEFYIIDNKSRDLKPRSSRSTPTLKDNELDDMLRQLYIYAAAVKREYGRFPKSLCFNCFKTGTFIEEPFKEEVYVKTLDWAKKSIEAIKDTDDFYPSVDYFSCRYICGVNEECDYKDMR